MEFKLDEMKETDWRKVAEIYLKGINTGIATFQTEAPSYEDWGLEDPSGKRDEQFIKTEL